MVRILIVLVAMLLLGTSPYYNNIKACTSVLVSGKVSKDGRPFILKNRDTPSLDNLIVQRKGEKYSILQLPLLLIPCRRVSGQGIMRRALPSSTLLPTI